MGYKSHVINKALPVLAMIAIGGYVLFSSTFAELHVQPSFLDFPVFIGEILLGICLCALALKMAAGQVRFRMEGWGWTALAVFVLIRALAGYVEWGPLAFRDAAVFYYAFFALIGYVFWSGEHWGLLSRRILFGFLFVLLVFKSFHSFFALPVVMVAALLTRREETPAVQFLCLAAVLLLAPYELMFFSGQRTVLIASSVVAVFLIAVLILSSQFREYLKLVWGILGIMIVLVFSARMVQAGLWKSMDPVRIWQSMPPVAVSDLRGVRKQELRLYNPDGSIPEQPNRMNLPPFETAPAAQPQVGIALSENKDHHWSEISSGMLGWQQDSKFANARFRVCIWRDMWKEYRTWHPPFGFVFGRPLRSPTLKYFHSGEGEWSRDGWIGAHNSFLYILYRGGIAGLVFICFLVGVWVRTVVFAVKAKSLTLMLLTAGLLYWLVAANFFLILELPYTAIPFWILLGVTLKQARMIKYKREFI